MEFRGKTVIVTGGAGGIGRAIARQFGAAGARVVIADIDNTAQAAAALAAEGGVYIPYVLDLRDVARFSSLVDYCARETGRLDILVNNAGIEFCGDVFDVTPDIWDTHHDVNLRAAFFMTQAVARWMRAHGGGHVINIASIEGATFSGRFIPYAATKSGIRGMNAALSVALARFGIRVNAVAPGHCETEMNKLSGDATALQRRLESIPLGRMGLPRDVADAVLFLASSRASYITGQIVTVDGGCTVWRS
jgi:NAD(P)-dependent dehydrogenase (short-subunit alcohol dehydrogenase family)